MQTKKATSFRRCQKIRFRDRLFYPGNTRCECAIPADRDYLRGYQCSSQSLSVYDGKSKERIRGEHFPKAQRILCEDKQSPYCNRPRNMEKPLVSIHDSLPMNDPEYSLFLLFQPVLYLHEELSSDSQASENHRQKLWVLQGQRYLVLL